jgi:hypothetical protein
MSWERHGWSLGQGVNNLHTLAIEKEAQRKRATINLKCNICSKSPKLFLACLTNTRHKERRKEMRHMETLCAVFLIL